MVSYALRRVGKISELTDIPSSWCQRYMAKYAQYDVTNQNMNPSDNVRADMFGRGWSPTGWPVGQNHNSWGRNSLGLFQREPNEGERRTRRPLLIDSGSNTGLMMSSRAHWPWGHIPDILPSNSDVLVSLQRADVSFTACVAEGGVSETS